MDASELQAVLSAHRAWLVLVPGGKRANLSRANLSEANLFEAKLDGANLREANLSEANLFEANLSRANLSKTVLDPANEANADVAGFARRGEMVRGYRTRTCGDRAVAMYLNGRIYSAWIFSTCETTECHPGLYLWPTLDAAREYGGDVEFIEVESRACDVHHVGNKWRTRAFRVIGAAASGE